MKPSDRNDLGASRIRSDSPFLLDFIEYHHSDITNFQPEFQMPTGDDVVALLLVSATVDPSPANNAKQNITGTRGLTAEMIAAAQTLSGEMSDAKNLLVPLDQYLKKKE